MSAPTPERRACGFMMFWCLVVGTVFNVIVPFATLVCSVTATLVTFALVCASPGDVLKHNARMFAKMTIFLQVVNFPVLHMVLVSMGREWFVFKAFDEINHGILAVTFVINFVSVLMAQLFLWDHRCGMLRIGGTAKLKQ